MRNRKTLLLVLLFAACALTGWFLPEAVFAVSDRAAEGRQLPVELAAVDLTYQTELHPLDKMTRFSQMSQNAAVELEQGIYLQADQIAPIGEEFLFLLTGQRLTLRELQVKPFLVSFETGGAVVAWVIEAQTEDSLLFEAVVDDESGAVLRASLFGWAEQCETLFPFTAEAEDAPHALAERLCAAVAETMTRCTGKPYTAALHLTQGAYRGQRGSMLLSTGDEPSASVSFLLLLEEGVLDFNNAAQP